MRYSVELGELLAFVDRLQAFEQHAETVLTRVDGQVADLHHTWSGAAAAAHRSRHNEWMAAATQMREALAELRATANRAHLNYTGAAQLNLDMLR